MIAGVVAIGMILVGAGLMFAVVDFLEQHDHREDNVRLLRELRRQPYENFELDQVRIVPREVDRG